MLRVLIVDDEPRVLNSLRMVLQSEGFEVETASSGAEALERLRACDFDVMVCDLCMSPVDGMELVRGARHLRPGTQVIILTGYASPNTAAEAQRHDVFDYMVKPVPAGVLAEAVRNAAAYGAAAVAGGAVDSGVRGRRNISLRNYLR
jgi:DNA-binding NtrC family response regulator